MTTTIAPTTTEYKVTFNWTASDWKDSTNEDGEYDYENQPDASTYITVTLPSDASPWDVYNEAEDEAIDNKCYFPKEDEDVYSWDDDGMFVEFNGKVLRISAGMLTHTTTWADFN